jgi:hypothetical protein
VGLGVLRMSKAGPDKVKLVDHETLVDGFSNMKIMKNRTRFLI